jgi:rhamnogalacturonan endolyase
MSKILVIIVSLMSFFSLAEEVVINERFSSDLKNWWIEGTKNVSLKNGRLFTDADGNDAEDRVCTVWCKVPVEGNVAIEYSAEVISSKEEYSNINFFFKYSDPKAESMIINCKKRSDGAYQYYHNLNGYIVTFLNNPRDKSDSLANPDGSRKARMRLRRCPGFRLVNETHDYVIKTGKKYDFKITVINGKIDFYVDGKKYLSWSDPEPLTGGYIGVRTFASCIAWDDVKVTEINKINKNNKNTRNNEK